MAKCADYKKTVTESAELFSIGSIINQALIEILISKKIISEEELVNHIGEINRQQEILFDGRA